MTDHQKKNIWITIPDENNSLPDESMQVPEKESDDVVQNKVFWGAGLVALIVFASVLLIPKQMAGVMQAQLFDGTFQVVPDFEEQDTGSLFTGGAEEGSEENTDSGILGGTTDENVVEAEAEAVSIQIEPLPETDTTGSDSTVDDTAATADAENTDEAGAVSDTPSEVDAESVTDSGAVATGEAEAVDVEPVIDAEPVGTEAGVSTGSAALLESLSKQLDEYKDKEAQNEQLIQDLMQMLEDQASVKPAAGDLAQVSSTGAEAAAQIGTGGTSAVPISGTGAVAGTSTGAYRYNTHTVTVSPYDVLAQNKGAQQAAYQANVSYTQVESYSQQNYNATLSGVQGQPDTGPAETMLFALLLASMGILLWGVMRAVRA